MSPSILISGTQPGDPVKGAKAIISAVEADSPPVHLLLGSDALDQLRAKLDGMRDEVGKWEEVTRGTDLAINALAADR